VNASIILPTYNERENIILLVQAIVENLQRETISFEILVVDDNSPDGTADAVRKHFGDDERIRLFVRTVDRGLARSIAHGIRQAQGKVVAVMDTDFNHDPALLPRMIKFVEYYDIIVGSRFTMGGGMEEQWRYNASFLFNFFVRFILHTQIQDNLCGFFTMEREKLLAMDLDCIFHGYGEYFMHLLFLAWKRGYSLLEIPAYYPVRKYGESKSRFFKMLRVYSMTAFRVRLGLR